MAEKPITIYEPQIYGYLRISTDKQDIDNFKNWILRKANDLKTTHNIITTLPVIFIEDCVSGKRPWQKRKLGELFNKMNKDDVLITFEVSRLGRDFRNLISFIAECDNKGIKIFAGDIDSTDLSITSNMKIFMKSMTAQQEREEISRRTKEALARRKAAGMKLGRPFQSDKLRILYPNIDERIVQDLNDGLKKYKIAQKYGISRETLRKHIRKYNIVMPASQCKQKKIIAMTNDIVKQRGSMTQ